MAAQKTFFISTSIPYVNAAPHIGFALEAVQADVLARFHRAMGEEVFFLSGTDDNALKNVRAAEDAGRNVGEYVAENSKRFEDLLQTLSISNDDFIRTSSDVRHRVGAQKLWSTCRPEDIYTKKYKGLYCIGCEEFKIEKELIDGECPEHPGKKLEEVAEENYFFRLSKYQGVLLQLIESNKIKIVPEIRKNETLAFIKGGLEDFSISRSKERARGWGIPVPGDESQIMYVWFDALSNYINALGYGDNGDLYKKFWIEGGTKVHAIGKGINRFHTIYWPAMLLSAGVSLPTTVFIHGYITVRGQKMSKTLGNVIDPNDLIKEFGVEATRYLLARKVSTFEDGDISLEKFKEAYNADLANGLGNLFSRTIKMATSYGIELQYENVQWPEEYVNYQTYQRLLQNFEIDRACDFVWSLIQQTDKRIQEKEPFKLFKTDPEGAKKEVDYLLRQLLRIADLLQSIMPETSKIISNAIMRNVVPKTSLFPRKD